MQCCVCAAQMSTFVPVCISMYLCASLSSGEESVLRALLLSRTLDVRQIALYPGEGKPIVLSCLHTQSGSSSTNDFRTYRKKAICGKNINVSNVFPGKIMFF